MGFPGSKRWLKLLCKQKTLAKERKTTSAVNAQSPESYTFVAGYPFPFFLLVYLISQFLINSVGNLIQ